MKRNYGNDYCNHRANGGKDYQTGWIQIKFTKAVVSKIAKVTFVADVGADTPRSWKWHASADGETWVELELVDGQKAYGNGEARTFSTAKWFESCPWKVAGDGVRC